MTTYWEVLRLIHCVWSGCETKKKDGQNVEVAADLAGDIDVGQALACITAQWFQIPVTCRLVCSLRVKST